MISPLRLPLLLLVAAMNATCLAQPVDQLLSAIDTTAKDTQQLRLLVRIAEQRSSLSTEDRLRARMLHLAEHFEKAPDPAVRALANKARTYELIWRSSSLLMAGRYREAANAAGQAGQLASVRGDASDLASYEIMMSELYSTMSDTVNELRRGYRAAELLMASGDSASAADMLMGMARMDTNKVRMRTALEFADRHLRPRSTAQIGYNLWYRAWILTAHGEHDEAIVHLLRADSMFTGLHDKYRGLNYWTLGEAYQRSGRSQQAIAAFRQCMALSAAHDQPGYRCGCARDLGVELKKVGDLAGAEAAWREAAVHGAENFLDFKISALGHLKDLLREQGHHAEALEVYEEWTAMRDSAARADATKDLMVLDFNAEQRADSLLHAQQQEAAAFQLQRERTNRNLLLAGAGIAIVFGSISYRQRRRTQKALKRSDELLLNILPEEVAEELKDTGTAEAKHFESATILFTDFKGFTELSEKVTPAELVQELNTCFKEFDLLMEKYRIEKIKTIGDAYMAAGGLPDPQHGSAADVVRAALEMQEFMLRHKAEREVAGKPYFEMRVGIHTGPVVAGIVGVKKFQYDIWGDTVNTAARMESSGEVGQVNISEATYALVKDDASFTFTPRGKVQAKGKGEMDMYFVGGSEP